MSDIKLKYTEENRKIHPGSVSCMFSNGFITDLEKISRCLFELGMKDKTTQQLHWLLSERVSEIIKEMKEYSSELHTELNKVFEKPGVSL